MGAHPADAHRGPPRPMEALAVSALVTPIALTASAAYRCGGARRVG